MQVEPSAGQGKLLVDDENRPAPRLADFELPADVAELLHREIYGQ